MFRLIKVNICGREYDCKAENFGGEFWLLHNCGGCSIVADSAEYSGSKRGNYYATKIARQEIDVTNATLIRDALDNFSSSIWLTEAGEIIDKPQRIRKSSSEAADVDAKPGKQAESKPTPAAPENAGGNIDLTDTISAELSALGKIGDMLAPAIIKAANAEANGQAKQILIDAINEAAEKAGGNACKVVEYHTARGVYKTEKAEVSHAKIETITKAIEAGLGVYLYGPAGTGKSHLAKQVAKRLNLDYYEDSKIENAFDLKGFVDASGEYVYTPFAKAYINGGLFFLDEYDASNSNATTAFNNALAGTGFSFPGIGYKDKHENFRVIAAGNTIGHGAARDKYGIEYCARNMQDAATLTRFPIKIECDYCEEIERFLAYPYIGEKSTALIEFAHGLRAATAATSVQCTCTYREIEAIAKLLSLGINIDEALNSLFGYLDADDKRMLSANIKGGGAFVEAFKRLAA